MIGYLLRQAAMDAKTGLVIKKYNDVSLIVSFIGMLIVLFTNKISIFLVVEVFFVGVVLILISSNLVPKCLKIMQRADAKAFASIYFSSFIIFGVDIALKVLCLSVFFANIFFMIWYHVIKREKIYLISEIHKPYFPFILSGYVITTLLYIFM